MPWGHILNSMDLFLNSLFKIPVPVLHCFVYSTFIVKFNSLLLFLKILGQL